MFTPEDLAVHIFYNYIIYKIPGVVNFFCGEVICPIPVTHVIVMEFNN